MRLVLTAFLPFALGYFLSFRFRSLNAVVAPADAHQLVVLVLLAMQAASWAWCAASREARDLA